MQGNFCHFSKLERFAFSRLSETDAKAKRGQAKIFRSLKGEFSKILEFIRFAFLRLSETDAAAK